MVYSVERGEGEPAAFEFGSATGQPVVDGVDQQRQPGDPLHRQHQKRVHSQRLAHRTRLEPFQRFHELRFIFPATNTSYYIIHKAGQVFKQKSKKTLVDNGRNRQKRCVDNAICWDITSTDSLKR